MTFKNDLIVLDAADLQAAYERDAPHSYPRFDPCPYPVLGQNDGGVWSERFDFSCESVEATQFEEEPVTPSRAPWGSARVAVRAAGAGADREGHLTPCGFTNGVVET